MRQNARFLRQFVLDVGLSTPILRGSLLSETFDLRGNAVPKYNTNFELSVEDLDLIETALRATKLAKTQSDIKARAADEDVMQIHDLLGRLHNQKTFFRPADGTYVGG